MLDYIIVGSGLFGAVCADKIKRMSKTCLVIDKRDHIGGNIFSEKKHGISVSKYGPHCFHVNNQEIWEYINKFAKFNNFINHPKVNYKGKIYSFPINLMTLHQLWGVTTPVEALKRIERERIPCEHPDNIEDYSLAHWGKEIYDIFIYGYTKKQWNKEPRELPASIIKRIPFRLNFDDNYYNDCYQGVPLGGYTPIIENMLDGVRVQTNLNFKDFGDWRKGAKKLIYSGPIDEFFDYKYGELEYRSLRFEEEVHEDDYQGNAVVNYTSEEVPWTRIVEYKHFENIKTDKTVIVKEYPQNWDISKTPYYPINDSKNSKIYKKYRKEAETLKDVIFGGRLGSYMYYDMHQVIASALKVMTEEFTR